MPLSRCLEMLLFASYRFLSLPAAGIPDLVTSHPSLSPLVWVPPVQCTILPLLPVLVNQKPGSRSSCFVHVLTPFSPDALSVKVPTCFVHVCFNSSPKKKKKKKGFLN